MSWDDTPWDDGSWKFKDTNAKGKNNKIAGAFRKSVSTYYHLFLVKYKRLTKIERINFRFKERICESFSKDGLGNLNFEEVIFQLSRSTQYVSLEWVKVFFTVSWLFVSFFWARTQRFENILCLQNIRLRRWWCKFLQKIIQ